VIYYHINKENKNKETQTAQDKSSLADSLAETVL